MKENLSVQDTIRHNINELGKLMAVFSGSLLLIGNVIKALKPNANELPYGIQPADGEKMIAYGLVGALVGSAMLLFNGNRLSETITAITKPNK